MQQHDPIYQNFLDTRSYFVNVRAGASFTPIYVLEPWNNPDESRNKYFSVSIWLFSGMTKDGFALDVTEAGYALMYKMFWCDALKNTKKLHESKISGKDGHKKITAYHPQVESFIEPIQEQARP